MSEVRSMAPVAAATSRARCGVVWLAVTGSVCGIAPLLVRIGTTGVHDGVAASRFDLALVGCCALLLLACGTWFWVVTTVVVAGLLRRRGGGGGPTPGAPGPARRLVLVACGVALTSGLAAPALATPGPIPADRGRDPLATALVGLPLPDRAVGGAVSPPVEPAVPVPHVPPATAPPSGQAGSAGSVRAPAAEVVVAPGDTLWGIAADRLRAQHVAPGHAAVERAWRALYASNRDRIGVDPDLILPATRLRLPDQMKEPR